MVFLHKKNTMNFQVTYKENKINDKGRKNTTNAVQHNGKKVHRCISKD